MIIDKSKSIKLIPNIDQEYNYDFCASSVIEKSSKNLDYAVIIEEKSKDDDDNKVYEKPCRNFNLGIS